MAVLVLLVLEVLVPGFSDSFRYNESACTPVLMRGALPLRLPQFATEPLFETPARRRSVLLL
jgi:hypothetical protein